MVGDHGRMMIRFNTAKHSDQAAGTGFSVTVEAVESGMCKIKRIWPGQFQNMQNIVLKIINNQSTPNNNTWNFHCCSTMLYDYNLPWWLLHSITCTNCLSNMIIFKAVLVLLVKMAENVRVTALVSLVRAQTDFPVPIATHWLVSYWKGVKTWYIWLNYLVNNIHLL